MKNLFPFLALALALDAVNYDASKGHAFTDEQLQTLEGQLKEFADLKAKDLDTVIAAKDAEIATLKTEKSNLQSIIDKIPTANPVVNAGDAAGGNADPDVNYFAERTKTHPVYQSIRNRLQQK